MSMTRRGLMGWIGGAGAALATAKAKTQDFVEHRIMKRPYAWTGAEMKEAGHQWLLLSGQVTAKKGSVVRVRVFSPDSPEDIDVKTLWYEFEDTKGFNLQSARGMKADVPLRVEISSRTPFTCHGVSATADPINKPEPGKPYSSGHGQRITRHYDQTGATESAVERPGSMLGRLKREVYQGIARDEAGPV